MGIIYAAATSLVNSPGSTPEITQDQLWAGLELKRSKPQLFLPVVETCDVLEDKGGVIVREVKFKDGSGIGSGNIGARVTERITHNSPPTSTAGSGLETFSSVGTNSRVLNIVSSGDNGELYLTFTFEWDHPEIESGSEEESKKQSSYQSTAPKAVGGTLKVIRTMVEKGEL